MTSKYLSLTFSSRSFWRKYGMYALCIFAFLFFLCPPSVQAEKIWYPVEVDVWQPPFNELNQREQKQYIPLKKALKKWRIRVFIPHLKDAYWLGVNYGLIDEARRLGVSLSIYEAGGYDRIEIQRRQIETVLADKPDGMIICAISQDGLNDMVERAREQGIPVVDLINCISSRQISARAAVSFWDTGYQVGSYIRRLQEKTGNAVKVAWFPGPDGAGWVAAGDAGFNEAIAGGAIKILTTLYGDTGSAAQGKLVGTALDQYADDLNFIVGTTVTAEAAMKILRKRRLTERIKVLSYYYSPGVHRGIRRGHIVAAPTDLQVIQARIAVDVMVRILEKKHYFKHVAPRAMLVDHNNIQTWDPSGTLAPQGFRPIFSINE